jgi:hypothetical protein
MKPPKSARGSTVAFGRQHCKGIVCQEVKDNPKGHTEKYRHHARCSSCEVWMLKTSLNEKSRCPCCNRRPRMKNFKQNSGNTVGKVE